MSSNLHPMLNVAIKAARAAGAIINRAALDVESVRVSQKQANDFVTEVDHASEQAIIDTCAAYGIAAFRKDGAPGVYTSDGAKIAALGLRVRRGCSFHGLAFNIAMHLEPFQRINPCGYAGQPVTTLLDCGGPGELRLVADVLVPHLCRQLGLAAEWRDDPPDLGAALAGP